MAKRKLQKPQVRNFKGIHTFACEYYDGSRDVCLGNQLFSLAELRDFKDYLARCYAWAKERKGATR
jgi:hypothetical protein